MFLLLNELINKKNKNEYNRKKFNECRYINNF